jgi:hypothetical protein
MTISGQTIPLDGPEQTSDNTDPAAVAEKQRKLAAANQANKPKS